MVDSIGQTSYFKAANSYKYFPANTLMKYFTEFERMV